MLDIIAKPFGMLLLWLYNLVGNYGIAIFLFTVVVKLILLPFQMRSKKSMMRMSALNPQIQELQKRHEGNQQKLQEEIGKLYREEKVNPMSGCLWMLIPYPILLALWRAIRFPLTTMMGVASELIAEGGAIYEKLSSLGFDFSGNNVYIQLRESQFITEHFSDFAPLSDKLVAIDYSFLGLNLGSTPTLRFWANGVSWATFGLFLIPIVSALLSWLQIQIGQKTNPGGSNEQANQQMKTMNLMMPLISLWIGFSMPAAMGLYWISNSLLYIVQEFALNKYYGKQLARETAEREARMRAREAEWERKRQETERLRAEGLTKENASTSKKKQQARQKAELDELKAAAIREEKAAKRARRGLPEKPEEDIPASQVGSRRYARGRAYVPDRFTNPEGAEEATAAAAARSAADEAARAEAEELDSEAVPAAEEPAVQPVFAGEDEPGSPEDSDTLPEDEDAFPEDEPGSYGEDEEFEEDPSPEDEDL